MKRVFGFLLAAIMLFSAVPVTAGEQAEAEQSGDISFAKAVGLIDTGADGSDTITRIELAEIFFNIITNNSVGAGYLESDMFNDVTGEQAYIADFAAARGIMSGDGLGCFSPDSKVTYIELLKAFVSFLGYAPHAEAMGGYPAGYYSQAAALKIAQNNPASYDAVVTMNKVASVLKLSLNVELMLPSSDGKKLEKNDDLDYLAYYRRIYRSRGMIEANYLTNLSNDSKPGYDEVMQNADLFKLTEGTDALRSMPGMNVDIYYKENDAGEREAIYFEEWRNTVLEIESDNVDSLSGRKLRYYKNGGTMYSNASLADDAIVVYNGAVCASYDGSVLNPYKDTLKDGKIRLIDNDSDSEYDVVIVDAYDSYVVSYTDGSKIFNRYRQQDIVDITAYDEGSIEIVNILNEPLRPEDIAAGDIINVSADIDGAVRRIVVTIDSYAGTLNAVSAGEGDRALLTVDGVQYKASAGFLSDFDISKLKGGSGVKVYFNKDALIAGIETDDYTTYRIGYLTDILKDEAEETYTLKIFSQDGRFERYAVGEKIVLDNENRSVKAEELLDPASDKFRGLVRYGADNHVIRVPVLYRVDKKTGQVSWLRMYDATQTKPLNDISGEAVKENCLFGFEGFDGITSRRNYPYRISVKSFGGKLLFSAATVIFYVPEDANRINDDEYYVVDAGALFKDGDVTTLFEAYGTRRRSPAADIAVVKGERYGAAVEVDYDNNVVLVEDVVSAYDEEEGEKISLIYGCSNKQQIVLRAAPDIVKVCPNPDGGQKKSLAKGDLIMVNTDQNNKIRTLELIYCAHENALQFATNPSVALYNTTKRFSFGRVIYNDGVFITVRLESSDGSFTTESYPVDKFVYLEYDRRDTGECRVSSAERLFDEYNYPGNASDVVIHTRNGDAKTITIYNN